MTKSPVLPCRIDTDASTPKMLFVFWAMVAVIIISEATTENNLKFFIMVIVIVDPTKILRILVPVVMNYSEC